MPDGLAEFLEDLRDNWRDQYWWSDHQHLQVILLSLLSGAIGLCFAWLEGKLKQRMVP